MPARRPESPRRRSRQRMLRDGVSCRRTRIPSGRICCEPASSNLQTAAAIGDTLGRIHAATADRRRRRRALRNGRALSRASSRALSRSDRTRASRSRASARSLVETTRATKRVLVHGDFSPKNLFDRAGGPGDPRRRMRVVRRPGVRSRVRAESPAAQRRVATAMARAVRRRVRCADGRVSAHVVWEPPASCERARGSAVARAACSRASTASRRSNI